MRGRRSGKTGGVFAGICRGVFRAENDTDGRESFAAVERSLWDGLPGSAHETAPLIVRHASTSQARDRTDRTGELTGW